MNCHPPIASKIADLVEEARATETAVKETGNKTRKDKIQLLQGGGRTKAECRERGLALR